MAAWVELPGYPNLDDGARGLAFPKPLNPSSSIYSAGSRYRTRWSDVEWSGTLAATDLTRWRVFEKWGHRRAVLSTEAVTTRPPSGRKAAETTEPAADSHSAQAGRIVRRRGSSSGGDLALANLQLDPAEALALAFDLLFGARRRYGAIELRQAIESVVGLFGFARERHADRRLEFRRTFI